ncbi:hypothetical protein NW768_004691 [Fusarium equiseti]|uniref:F-box domain-containing protein n=1 Tax=Fusarium equiseti TaxID=61235 RepID=A0ABQ8RH14_FUSEQ|nr:hypothetical protein NW768_004691 [Fusarium equiseti]
MDRLPPETMSNIVGHVRGDMVDHALTPLSLICRRLQPIVEAKIYRDLSISFSSSRRLSHKSLANILTPTRLSYIRELVVTFTRRNLRFPDNDIRQVFDLLTRVPHTPEPRLEVHFSFDFFELASPSSVTAKSTPTDELPELPMVRYCSLVNCDTADRLSPHALCYMASKMPRLRDLGVTILGISPIHHRIELARSLTDLPMSIHYFSLSIHQKDGVGGLLVMENGEDILTRQLRRFSQREGLKRLIFSGGVEPSIFWPPHSAVSEPRRWPTLECFMLHLDNTQYLAGRHAAVSLDVPRDADDPDGIYAPKGMINAFCQALAKCSASMPKATDNYISFNDIRHTTFKYDTTHPETPCVELGRNPSLELDEDTLSEWRKTAEVHNLDFRMRIEGNWLYRDYFIIS